MESSVPPATDSAAPQAPSPFTRALENYVNSRPKKSKTPHFIRDIQHQHQNGEVFDRRAVQRAIIDIERASTDRSSTQRMRKFLNPVVSIMTTYAGVVDTLCNADPMPTALVWGCLKAVIQCSSRFLDLYDKISSQLADLEAHLELLTRYEELFGESSTMQELLQTSYIDIIRFWHRVEKECRRCIANRMARALASFSTTKLDEIISRIDKNAQRINMLVPAVQERLARGEREDAAEERRLAGIARDEQKLLFELQAEELKIRNMERKHARKKNLDNYLLGGALQVNESNHRHQEQNTHSRGPDTCQWLLNEESFLNWLDPSAAKPILWVNAGPGAGKSVLTAYAIEDTQQRCNGPSAICFQYYTFDEEFSSIQVFRALAEQLGNQLWEHIEDIPEQIHAITQRAATSSRSEDLKNILRQLMQQMTTTYIFLDGLDEECDHEKRWHQLKQVLDFFIGLATLERLPVKIWCSSQARTCLDSVLQLFPTLQVTPDLSNRDIEQVLKSHIPQLDNLEIDEGYRSLVLKDLQSKADGCFLWASLMLDSVTNAASLHDIQKQINEGLPKSYEMYYMRKLNSIDQSDRKLVSTLLASIVYARRPLRLDEICEATAALYTSHGQNIDRGRKVFKKKIITLCQPLVRVQDLETSYGTITTCTLTHATVRNFLIKQAESSELEEGSGRFHIYPGVLAEICLKYLMQPCFSTLIKKDEVTFRDGSNEDIDSHQLLSYTAKYWDKHLDKMENWKDFRTPVRDFVFSKNFFTCLQIQSLLVGGQFQFWWNSNNIEAGPHIKRVFPDWLAAQCDETLENDYRLFINDWGYLLNEIINLGAPYAGELDRCFFGGLGTANFMHNGPSRYTSYQLCPEGRSADPSTRYFDAIDEYGHIMIVLALHGTKNDTLMLEFDCQHWDLTGCVPMLQNSQALTLDFKSTSWLLYDFPGKANRVGKPPVVAFSSDLALLRIGSQIYTKDNDGLYQLNSGIDLHGIFIDEFGSRDRHVAITTRRDFPTDELQRRQTRLNDEFSGVADQPIILEVAKGFISGESSSTVLSTILTNNTETSVSDETSDTAIESKQESDADSINGVQVEAPQKFTQEYRGRPITIEELEADEALFKSDSNKSGNTAEEDWSDGSSDFLSDEIEDEDQWNDWGNERMTIEELNADERDFSVQLSASSVTSDALSDNDDLESIAPASEDLNFDEVWKAGDDDKIKISGFTFKEPDHDIDSDDSALETASSIESDYSQSNYSDGNSDDNSDDDLDVAKHLDALTFGKGSREGKQRISVQVHEVSRQGKGLIFHFARYVKRGIFDSPPVFHPSKPLLVWPLGDTEILFADYRANTFFTRMLCCSRFKTCHVFVKAHFSGSGEYLHFAALEAGANEAKGEDEKGSLSLSLQVSTHRLSVRKPTKSPTRLVYRTTITLGSVPTLNLSNSPYTFHWTAQELYFTTRGQTLDVMRIPLFPDPKSCKIRTCYIQKEIYLPRTIESRTLHFFPQQPLTPQPPTLGSKSSGSHSSKPDAMAKVIIGSHSAIPSQGLYVPRYQLSPPIGVLLHDETDLGGWKCKALSASGEPAQRMNNAGGRLQGKFETFDRNEDCDIIPFLY